MTYVKTQLPTLKTHVVNLKRDAKDLSRDLQRLEVRGKLGSKTLYYTKSNVALTSKIILIVACEYSFLSTLPLRWEVSKGALRYVEKPLASSLFLEGTKPASRNSRLHQMAMESLFAGYDEKRLLFPRYTFGCIEGSQ